MCCPPPPPDVDEGEKVFFGVSVAPALFIAVVVLEGEIDDEDVSLLLIDVDCEARALRE